MPIVINATVYEEARKRLNLSHAEVARRAGISYSSLRKWLTIKAHPNSENVDKLSEVLGEHPAHLFKLVKKEN